MLSRSASVACATLLGALAACHGATPPAATGPSPPSAPSAAPVAPVAPAQARVVPEQARVPREPLDERPSGTSPGDGDQRAPAVDPAFRPIELRLERLPDGTVRAADEVAARFPAISDDGRTVAVLDERPAIEEGASLHLVLLDTRTNRDTTFTLWSESTPANRRQGAEKALRSSRWQSLVAGKTSKGVVSLPASGRRQEAEDVELAEGSSPGGKVELVRTTPSGESRLSLVPHGLPGKMAPAAVPTRDVGAPCGWWSALSAGWVSQDGKVYVFRLGASLGGRCATSPTPVEYGSWVSR